MLYGYLSDFICEFCLFLLIGAKHNPNPMNIVKVYKIFDILIYVKVKEDIH